MRKMSTMYKLQNCHSHKENENRVLNTTNVGHAFRWFPVVVTSGSAGGINIRDNSLSFWSPLVVIRQDWSFKILNSLMGIFTEPPPPPLIINTFIFPLQHVTYYVVRKALIILWALAAILTCLPFLGFGIYYDRSGSQHRCFRYRDATKPVDVAYAFVVLTFGIVPLTNELSVFIHLWSLSLTSTVSYCTRLAGFSNLYCNGVTNVWNTL